jgi:hypothetical protein
VTERELEKAVAAAVRGMEPWELLELARALPPDTYRSVIELGTAELWTDMDE